MKEGPTGSWREPERSWGYIDRARIGDAVCFSPNPWKGGFAPVGKKSSVARLLGKLMKGRIIWIPFWRCLSSSLRARVRPRIAGWEPVWQVQAYNQPKFYSTNILGEAKLSGATAELVFNCKIDETVPWHKWAVRCAGVYRRKVKSKSCVFRCFLKVATETPEQTDGGR